MNANWSPYSHRRLETSDPAAPEDWHSNSGSVPRGRESEERGSPLKWSENKLEEMSLEYSNATSIQVAVAVEVPHSARPAFPQPNTPPRRSQSPVELSNSSRVSITDFVRKLNRCDLSGAVQAAPELSERAADATISWTKFEQTVLTDVTRGTAPLHVGCRGVHQFDTIEDVAHEYDTSAEEAARNTKVEKCCHKLLELAEKHLDDRTAPSLRGLTAANGGPRNRDDHHCLVDPADGTEINSAAHQFRQPIKYCSLFNSDRRFRRPRLLKAFDHKSSSADDMFGESGLPLLPRRASNESKTCRLPGCGSAGVVPEAGRFAEPCSAARLEGTGEGVGSAGSRYGRRQGGGKKGPICLALREMAFEETATPEDVCNNHHQILAYLNGALIQRESNIEIAAEILILESLLRHHREGPSQTRLCPASVKCDCDIVPSASPKGVLVHTIPRRQKIEYVMHKTRTIRLSPEELSPESVSIKSRVDTRETPAESELSGDETCESSKQTFLSPLEVAPFHDQKQTIYTFVRQHQDNIGALPRRVSLPANFKQFEYVPDRPRSTIDVAVQTDSEPEVEVLEAKHDKLSNDAWIAIRSKRNLDALNLTQGSAKRFAPSAARKIRMSFRDEEGLFQDEKCFSDQVVPSSEESSECLGEGVADAGMASAEEPPNMFDSPEKGDEYRYTYQGEKDCIDRLVPSSEKTSSECLAELNDIDVGGGMASAEAEVPGRMFDSREVEAEEDGQLVGTSIKVITCGERKWSDGAPAGAAAACGDIGAGSVCEIFEYGHRDGIDPPNQQARSVFQWDEEKLPPSDAFPKASKRLRLRLGLSKRARPPPLHPIRYSQNPIKSKNIPRRS